MTPEAAARLGNGHGEAGDRLADWAGNVPDADDGPDADDVREVLAAVELLQDRVEALEWRAREACAVDLYGGSVAAHWILTGEHPR